MTSLCRVCGAPTHEGPFGQLCAVCLLRPVTEVAESEDVSSGEEPGDKVGRYTLIEIIGEGGFGMVWKAEQLEPVHREVALKILKPGMDSREVIARFEQERQALAMMDHPCIAHVYDAGATSSGRPYFVMELVNGEPITTFCEQKSLPLRARLELFMTVCGAVQHAHQKGIIHRDLKPSNILVTEVNGTPAPRIIDFGIAKALETNGLARPLMTMGDQMMGTPVYMSPEQVDAVGDVDTRADVYSLGVLLYEMLAGRPPFEAKTLAEAGWVEMRRIIREVDPRKPSTLLRERGLATNKTSRLEVRRDAADDLDWIVMKCLEKERARRYETANGLALDVQRHLDHAPVLARPPSRWYVLQKIVRRNRVAFIAAALVLLSLVAGIIVSAMQMQRAQRAEKVALQNLREAESARAATKAVNEFLVAALGSPQPGRDGMSVTVSETMERAAARADTDLANAPESHLGVLKALAQTNQSLGLSTRAAELTARIMSLARTVYESDSARLAAWLNDGVRLLMDSGRQKDALKVAEEALALKITDKDLRLSLVNRATEAALTIDATTAEPWARRAGDESEAAFGKTDERTLRARVTLATVLQRLGRTADAETEARAAMKAARESGGRDAFARAAFRLADLLRYRGDMEEVPLLGEAHQWLKSHAGAADETASLVSAKLAESFQRAGRFDDAARVKREMLAALKSGKPDLARELTMTVDAADAVMQTSDTDGARALYESARDRCREHFGAQHPLTMRVQRGLALCLLRSGQRDEGVALLRSTLAKGQAGGTDGGAIMNLLHELASERFNAGALEESLPLYQQRLRVSQETFGAGNLNTLLAQRDVGDILTRLHRTSESLPLLRDAVAKMSPLLFASDPAAVLTRDLLVTALIEAGQIKEALEVREQVLTEARQKLPAGHAFLQRAEDDLKNLRDRAEKKSVTPANR